MGQVLSIVFSVYQHLIYWASFEGQLVLLIMKLDSLSLLKHGLM